MSSEPVELRPGDLEFSLFESAGGARFAPDGSREHLDVVAEFSAQAFYDGGGVPTNCEASFAATYLLVPGGDDDDDFVRIGAFDYVYEVEGEIGVTARVFDEADDAALFLETIADTVAECPFGYELSSLDPPWRLERITTSDADGLRLPDGVTALYHEEVGTESLDVLHRNTFLVYANVAIAVSCEVRAGSPFDYDDCDTVAEQIAEQLVELQ